MIGAGRTALFSDSAAVQLNKASTISLARSCTKTSTSVDMLPASRTPCSETTAFTRVPASGMDNDRKMIRRTWDGKQPLLGIRGRAHLWQLGEEKAWWNKR